MKKLFTQITRLIKPAKTSSSLPEGTEIPRDQHNISRSMVSSNALKVLYRLRNANFAAYIVGGGVRDLLLGREPKDFDVVTDATPDEVKKLFTNCRLIGKRFRLAHIYFKHDIIEVATFRAPDRENNEKPLSDHGVIMRDNVFGTLEDDVWRRDFSINALYYNIGNFSIVDYVGGLQDLEQGIIRIIGHPEDRLREDPVRILRAVRFAAKLGFTIDPATAEPIPRISPLLQHISNARLFEEALKLLLAGCATQTFTLLRHHNLLQYLFPATEEILASEEWHQVADSFLLHALTNTDTRIANDQPVSPAFLFAAMLWYPLQQKITEHLPFQPHYYLAFEKAANDITRQQCKHTAVPKRLTSITREIWSLQVPLERRHKRKIFRIIKNPCFRAAYDFLLLRSQSEPSLLPCCEWWTSFQQASHHQKNKMVKKLKSENRDHP